MRFIFRVIVLQSALSRVIAAWSGVPAHPLAPGPANGWQQVRERKTGRSRSSMPWPHPASLSRVTAGVRAHSHAGGSPCATASLLPRDPHRHPHPDLNRQHLPQPTETTLQAPGPLSCRTGSSFTPRKPEEEGSAPDAGRAPPPSARHGLANPMATHVGGVISRLQLKVLRLWEGK